MAKTGPPSKLNEYADKIIDALLKKLPFTYACRISGINEKTGYRWLAESEEFAKRCKEARAVAVLDLVGRVTIDDPWKILKNIGKDEFKDRVEEVHTQKTVVELDAGDGSTDEFKGY